MHPGAAALLSTYSLPHGDTEVSAGFTAFPSIVGGSIPTANSCTGRKLLPEPSAAAAVGLRPTSLCRQAGSRARQGVPPGRAPEAGAPVAWVQGVYHRLMQLFAELCRGLRQRCGIAAGRAPSSAAEGMEPGTRLGAGSSAAAGKPVPSGSHTPRAPLSLSHSHIAAALACAMELPVCDTGSTSACARRPLPQLWEHAGNNPRSTALGAFSCCASL